MAQIAPFSGIHYDPSRVTPAEVIAPPYDVLSPAQQDALYARDPYNIVRLILSRETPEDDSGHNRYTRAAEFLQESLRTGILTQDETPSFYEYIQRFPHPLEPERIVERHTLLVALKLEPYERGVVLPHEETHPKAKADRLNLMRATHANPEPIYGLYSDPQQTVVHSLLAGRESQEPMLQATYSGPGALGAEQHILYRHTDSCLLSDMAEFFASRRIWIADGHHRYETALAYSQEVRENSKHIRSANENANESVNRDENAERDAPTPADFILIGLSAFEDPGLVVLPTHRLVKNVPAARMEELPLLLERYFHLHVLSISDARSWIHNQIPGQARIVVLIADRGYALTLRDRHLVDEALDSGQQARGEAWRRLDVTVLQTLVLDRSLNISWQSLAHTSDVAYTRDEEEAVQKVQSGEYQIACLLQMPTVAEVRDVAAAGDKMPQKSTFFYPKLWSGLILRTLDQF